MRRRDICDVWAVMMVAVEAAHGLGVVVQSAASRLDSQVGRFRFNREIQPRGGGSRGVVSVYPAAAVNVTSPLSLPLPSSK